MYARAFPLARSRASLDWENFNTDIYIYIYYVCMYIRVVGTNSARSGVLARVNELRLDPRGN